MSPSQLEASHAAHKSPRSIRGAHHLLLLQAPQHSTAGPLTPRSLASPTRLGHTPHHKHAPASMHQHVKPGLPLSRCYAVPHPPPPPPLLLMMMMMMMMPVCFAAAASVPPLLPCRCTTAAALCRAEGETSAMQRHEALDAPPARHIRPPPRLSAAGASMHAHAADGSALLDAPLEFEQLKDHDLGNTSLHVLSCMAMRTVRLGRAAASGRQRQDLMRPRRQRQRQGLHAPTAAAALRAPEPCMTPFKLTLMQLRMPCAPPLLSACSANAPASCPSTTHPHHAPQTPASGVRAHQGTTNKQRQHQDN